MDGNKKSLVQQVDNTDARWSILHVVSLKNLLIRFSIFIYS